jgi:tetratricopeptide (TPR) repeat protein
MFFMRIRRHARWVFILLAIVFALAFAFAGVGTGSTGIGDMLNSFPIFGGGSSSSNPIKTAQKKVDKAGKDTAKLAPALLELGRAEAAKGKTTDAQTTYERYLKLRPNDAQATYQLALVYRNEADTQYQQLTAITNDVVQSAPVITSFVTDPIASAVHQDAVAKAGDIYKPFRAAKQKELETLAAATKHATGADRSKDLADAAQDGEIAVQTALTFSRYIPESPQARSAQKDVSTWAGFALDAYKGYLKLHPHDSLTATLKQRIAALQPFAPAPAKTSGR